MRSGNRKTIVKMRSSRTNHTITNALLLSLPTEFFTDQFTPRHAALRGLLTIVVEGTEWHVYKWHVYKPILRKVCRLSGCATAPARASSAARIRSIRRHIADLCLSIRVAWRRWESRQGGCLNLRKILATRSAPFPNDSAVCSRTAPIRSMEWPSEGQPRKQAAPEAVIGDGVEMRAFQLLSHDPSLVTVGFGISVMRTMVERVRAAQTSLAARA
jgi:hypothetical protein